jgi:hypothetical protein
MTERLKKKNFDIFFVNTKRLFWTFDKATQWDTVRTRFALLLKTKAFLKFISVSNHNYLVEVPIG